MKKTVLAMGASALVALSACSDTTTETLDPVTAESQSTESDAADNTTGESGTDNSSTDAGQQNSAGIDVAVSASDAIDTALQAAGAGELTSISLDREQGGYVYDITLADGQTEWEYDIDASTGEILKEESDQENDPVEAVDITAPMTLDEALQIARETHDGEIVSWSLDSDDGRVEYDIEFADDTDVTIDVATGEARLDR